MRRNISNLQKVKADLVKRAETAARTAEYKARKAALREAPGTPRSGASGSVGRPDSAQQHGSGGGGSAGGGGGVETLGRLVELEKRIADLEAGGLPSDGGGFDGPHPGMAFKKKRAAPGAAGGAARTVFAVKIVDKSMLPAKKIGRGGLTQPRGGGGGRGGGAGISIERVQRIRAKQEKRMSARDATARQDGVIRDWMSERKAKEQARKARVITAGRPARGGPGATGGAVRGARTGPPAGGARRVGAGGPGGGGASRPAPGAARVYAPSARVRGGKTAQFHEIRKEFENRKRTMYARTGPGRGGRGGPAAPTRGVAPPLTRATLPTKLGSRLGGAVRAAARARPRVACADGAAAPRGPRAGPARRKQERRPTARAHCDGVGVNGEAAGAARASASGEGWKARNRGGAWRREAGRAARPSGAARAGSRRRTVVGTRVRACACAGGAGV